MKNLLIALTILISVSVSAQDQGLKYGKNLVSVELGMFHRGLIGASYVRLFIKKEQFLFGGGGGAGIGGIPLGGGINQFYYATCYLAGVGYNIGRGDRLFISANIDLRYIDYHHIEYETIGNETFSSQRHFTVFNFAPYIGVSILHANNCVIQMRLPPLHFFTNDEKHAVEWGGVGISAGILL